MPKILVCAALLFLSARSSYAQWERVVVAWTGKGDAERPVEHSSSHPLQYYLTPSAERDPINSLCLGCPIATMDGPKRTLQDFVVETSQRTLGESYGRKIIEIVLSFRDSPKVKRMYVEQAARENRVLNIDPDTPEETPLFQWSSVVMERSPGAYQELYMLIDVGVFVRNLNYASVLTIEGAQILGTAEHYEGNGGMCGQRYWVLDRNGPWLIDFSAVDKEMKKLIPRDANMVPSCPSLATGEFEISNWIIGDCHACNLGAAVVHFRLDGHRALPVSSSFEPEKDPPQPN